MGASWMLPSVTSLTGHSVYNIFTKYEHGKLFPTECLQKITGGILKSALVWVFGKCLVKIQEHI